MFVIQVSHLGISNPGQLDGKWTNAIPIALEMSVKKSTSLRDEGVGLPTT